jgi:uncharacterized protein YydD (DUF2326 family)
MMPSKKLSNLTYKGQHGDNSIENLFNLVDVGVVFEAGVTDTYDFVQIILIALVRTFHRYLSSKALEVGAELFGLDHTKQVKINFKSAGL